jgi:hypothetical protein
VAQSRAQSVLAGLVPRRWGRQSYDGVPLHRSMGKYNCRYSGVLQLNFKLVYANDLNKWLVQKKKPITGAWHSLTSCGHMRWYGSHTALRHLRSVPRRASHRCACVTTGTGSAFPAGVRHLRRAILMRLSQMLQTKANRLIFCQSQDDFDSRERG